MINAPGLIEDIKALLDDVGFAERFDEVVMHLSNTSLRESLIEALDKIVKTISGDYNQRALLPIIRDSFLVHSSTEAGAKITLEEDNIRSTLHIDESWMTRLEAGGHRYTYYSEFMNRYELLRGKILRGDLDEVLSLNPLLILHGISGFNGEFLLNVGWDPLRGETYSRFKDNPMDKAMKEYEANHDENRRLKTEAGEAFKKILVAAFQKPPPVNHPPFAPSEDEAAKERQKDVSGSPPIETFDRIKEKISGQSEDAAVGIPIVRQLGLALLPVDDEVRRLMNLNRETRGLLVFDKLGDLKVKRVKVHHSPTPYKVGNAKDWLEGDIIVSVENIPLAQVNELLEYLNYMHKNGSGIKFGVLRGSKLIEIKLTL